jgi:hypothetical protein
MFLFATSPTGFVESGWQCSSSLFLVDDPGIKKSKE